MSRKRGRPQRHYRLRVRTERRDPIDYAKLAEAALEQAAMDQSRREKEGESSSTPANDSPSPAIMVSEEPRHDRLA